MKILVTGGASGLGAAITRQLASQKENEIFFTYNTSSEKAGKIKSDLPNAFPLKCDFNREEEVATLCNKITELGLDVLINNAYTGSFIDAHFHKTPSGNFLSSFKTNIVPVIEITQAAINTFRKKKSGKIITVLTSALIGNPPVGASVYVANKAYLQELTKVWAFENARFNITSNSVSPSFMLTDFTSKLDERLIEQIKENQPQKKLVEPEEVAKAIEFLCSSASKENGLDIVLNAGASIQ